MLFNRENFVRVFKQYLNSRHGKTLEEATNFEKYYTLAAMVKTEMSEQWIKTNEACQKQKAKQLYYLSVEFLIGRLLGSNLLNLGETEEWQELLKEIGLDLNALEEAEPDAGLGNGGLGRLAACFMDSLASLNLPGHGSSIRYKYGLFRQKISGGEQVEVLDNWLRNGYPWESRREELAVYVKFGGQVTSEWVNGRLMVQHRESQLVRAVPYDVPIVGYHNGMVNTLRLWNAEAPDVDRRLDDFNQPGKADVHRIESITELLYPDDSTYEGRVLRLKQQYFMVSAALQRIVEDYKDSGCPIVKLAEKVAIHINDTHPALAVPELMRILMDKEGLRWEEAWHITTNVLAYTNHTILPEALEKWPVDTMRELLPRIFQIITEINERFCKQLWSYYPGNWKRISEMAVVGNEQVRMAHMAIVGSHSVNGVAALHTRILEKEALANFYRMTPYKFNNKTNGITHRRWLMLANPGLSRLITEAIGNDSWIREPEKLAILEAYRQDGPMLEALRKVKAESKQRFSDYLYARQGIRLDPTFRFDVQVKRIHAYKRQVMNALHLLYLYRQLQADPNMDIDPVAFIFGGKAAPGYDLAKRTIKLISDLVTAVNRDPVCKGKLQGVFVENFNVTKGEYVYPAADVSEQISLASKEASGTGNMKFMMNGAITLGTWDGANVEIAELVGRENIVIFGMSPEAVIQKQKDGTYRSWEIYRQDPLIRDLLDTLSLMGGSNRSGQTVYEDLVNHDPYMVLGDLHSYIDAHERVAGLYRDQEDWSRRCLINIARSGYFSSDRTIREYARDIWMLDPIKLD